ncbi:hypothetical protein ACYCIT_25610, partial [Klebsiella pneumoniae]
KYYFEINPLPIVIFSLLVKSKSQPSRTSDFRLLRPLQSMNFVYVQKRTLIIQKQWLECGIRPSPDACQHRTSLHV